MPTSVGLETSTLAGSCRLDSPLESEQLFSNKMGIIMLAAKSDVVGHRGARTIVKNASLDQSLDHVTPEGLFVVLSSNDIIFSQSGMESNCGVKGSSFILDRTLYSKSQIDKGFARRLSLSLGSHTRYEPNLAPIDRFQRKGLDL